MDKKLTKVLLSLFHFKSPPMTNIKWLICYHVIDKLIFIEIFSIKCLKGNEVFKIDFQRTILSGIFDEMTPVDVFMNRRIVEYQLFITAHLSIRLAEFHSSISCLSWKGVILSGMISIIIIVASHSIFLKYFFYQSVWIIIFW